MIDTKINSFYNKLTDSDRLNNLITPYFDLNNYSGITKYYLWKCNKCNEIFESRIIKGSIPRCSKCFPLSISNKEKEIVNYIKSFNIEVIENTREIISPQELDIYIPFHNLAIEFDGIYWHSDIYKKPLYHLNKTLECEKLGIRLIHIFEDEWIYKQDIVKSRLKNILGLNTKRVGARKCIIKEIDSKTKNLFLEKYHLQGSDNSSIKLGAYYNKELIGVMTFGLPRRSLGRNTKKEKEYELIRFATISDTYTPGLASKILKFFINKYNPEEVYSYADRRWSQGNLYKSIGFEFDSYTSINYWYFKNVLREHRYKYRKSELEKLFPNVYSKEKTEFEIMDELGYFRIYDCGNYKFIWKKV